MEGPGLGLVELLAGDGAAAEAGAELEGLGDRRSAPGLKSRSLLSHDEFKPRPP